MARAGGGWKARDMVLSLLVILIPLVVISYLLTTGPDQPDVETVSWERVADRAAAQAPYEVLVPAELPAGWRATRVSWTPEGEAMPTGEPAVRSQWRLGLLTDADIYIELVQGDKQPAEMIEEVSREGVTDGTSRVAGQQWDRLISPDERTRSLVWTRKPVTTIVTGDLSYAQLATYAASLQPAD